MNQRFDPNAAVQSVLFGGGHMGEEMRARDWSRTAVGPVHTWPQSLRTVVRVLLDSRYAMWMAWGPELSFFCNDAYRPTLGIKQGFLGTSARKVWAEIWPDIGPRIEHVLRSGTATWDESLLLFLQRSGFVEETYHSFSYSPVYDDVGRVAGMLCVVSEDTGRTVNDRRLAVLATLASDTLSAQDAEQACEQVAAALAGDARDLPFALLYLMDEDGRSARLVAQTGLPAGASAAPLRMSMDEAQTPDPLAGDAQATAAAWPLQAVMRTGAGCSLGDVAERHPGLVAGPWPEPITQALVLPLARPGANERPAGFLVAGVSPRLPLDAGYRRFVDLVASRISAAISDARAFAEEKRRVQALAELDRAKTVFFSNVSHELRTPLTLLLSPIDELLAAGPDGPAPADAHAQLQLAQRNGQRLLRLVNTLLDFSRIEAGRLQALFEPLDLAALTIDLASVFRSALERAGLALVIDCTPLAEPVFVDRGMWEKVVLNLLSNAFKFTLEGEVRVALHADAESAYLTVSDTGCGIPEAAMPHLFERFYRVEGARGRSIEGTGIGLALVRELVRLHGGEVAAHSRAGQGSRFAVSVPLGQAHLPPEHVAAAALPHESSLDAGVYFGGDSEEVRDTAWGALDAPSSTAATAAATAAAAALLDVSETADASAVAKPGDDTRPLVLVADDNADMRGYLHRLLASNHRVITAADGAAALELARTERPGLVLSDVMMPRMNGFDLLRALRDDAATDGVPVILLSARAGEEARIEGLAAGADDYVVKPFNARELLARVSGTLALARLRRERAEREAALRAETENVLESVTEGFVAIDADWQVTYANSAAERLVSIRREDMFGRSIWELFPGLAGHSFEATYRRAMRERVSVRLDGRYDPLGVWFEVNVYPVTGGGLAFYFRDVLASRLLQESLHASDKRNRLLVALDDATRAVDDADQVVAVSSRLIGEHFGADRCAYAQVEADGEHVRVGGVYCREGVAPIAGRHRLLDFGAEVIALQRGGHALVVTDAASDPRVGDALGGWQAVGIAAAVGVPLLKNGRMVATLALHQGVQRAWSGDEVDLLRLFVNRCWEAVERAHAVRALRESEHEFRVLADAMPQIVYVTEADGRTSFVNRQWSEYTGQSDAQAGDLPAVVHPDDMPGLQQSWQQAVQAGTTLTAEFRLRHARTGRYRWFLTRAVPSRDATGRIVRWYGTSTDIDAHKLGEQALRASEQRFRRVADSLPHSVFSFDPTGTAVWVNRHAAEFAGSAELLLAARRYELIHPDDRNRVRTAWQRSLATGEPYEAEVRMRRHDGVWRWTLSRAVALREEATGHITEWIAGSVDIDELRNAQHALQEADRRKDEFLATLAHELRNPLAPLRNAVHILQITHAPETAGRVHAMMQRQIDHMVRLVDDLLEVSRITGGKIDLRRAPVQLAEVLRGAVETSRPLIEAADLRLEQHIAEEPMLLDADAVRLAQVFANLLNNAAKYTDVGGRIELAAHRENDQALVTVRDTGIGIAADMLPRVFDLFTQIDRDRGRSQGGLGIGLSLVKSLVGMHGGSVEAASAGPGRGAEFTVRLPLAPAGLQAEAADAQGAASTPSAQRVLVVDDNVDAADSLGVLLEFMGASVKVVHDGPAALAAVQTHRPSVVLLDIGMPGMDGYEVARRLRAMPGCDALTLVALTGWGQAKDRERTRDSGFDHHLVKPADLQALQGLLGEGDGEGAPLPAPSPAGGRGLG